MAGANWPVAPGAPRAQKLGGQPSGYPNSMAVHSCPLPGPWRTRRHRRRRRRGIRWGPQRSSTSNIGGPITSSPTAAAHPLASPRPPTAAAPPPDGDALEERLAAVPPPPLTSPPPLCLPLLGLPPPQGALPSEWGLEVTGAERRWRQARSWNVYIDCTTPG